MQEPFVEDGFSLSDENDVAITEVECEGKVVFPLEGGVGEWIMWFISNLSEFLNSRRKNTSKGR